MKLLQRLKNVFTNHLIDPKDVSDKINETLKELQSIKDQEPVKAPVYPFYIDWDRIGIPFSVERTTNDDGEWITSIGYWPAPQYGVPNEPKEWFLFITKDQHETLVEEFKSWLSSKEQTNKENKSFLELLTEVAENIKKLEENKKDD